jgi:hypothetical protein
MSQFSTLPKVKIKDDNISDSLKPGLVKKILRIVPKIKIPTIPTVVVDPIKPLIKKPIINIVRKPPSVDSLMKDLYGKNKLLTLAKTDYHQCSQILQILDNPNSIHARDIYFALMEKFPIKARKCSLVSIIRNQKFVPIFNDLTLTMKKMAINAYQLLNLHLQRVISLNLPIPDLSDQLIYSNICRIVSTNRSDKIDFSFVDNEELKKTGIIFHSLLPKGYSVANRFGLNNFTNTLVRQIQTATINHLNLNIIERLNHFLKLQFGIKNEYMRKNICLKILYKNSYSSKFDTNLQTLLILQIFKKYRLNLNPNEKAIVNSDKLIKLYSFLQKSLEVQGKSSFSLVPLSCGFIPDYLDITSSLLPEFFKLVPEKLKRQKDPEYKLMSTIDKWFYFFNLNCLPKCNGEFAFNISSDAYGCTVLFNELPESLNWSTFKKLSYKERSRILLEYLQNQKLVKESQPDEFKDRIQKLHFTEDTEIETETETLCPYKLKDFKYYFGNDPGTRYFFTIDVAVQNSFLETGYIESSDKKRIRCSQAEYKKVSEIREYQQWLNEKSKKITELKILAENSLHVCGYQKLEKNLENVLLVTQNLLNEYSKPEYRLKRFDRFKKKLVAFEYMRNKILDGKNGKDIIIGWGDGGTNQKGFKGCHLPHKEFLDFLKRTTEITFHEINEYNTSKKCSKCGCDTEKLKIDYEKHLDYISNNAKSEKAKEKLKKLLESQTKLQEWREKTGKKEFLKKGFNEIYAITRCKNNECRITWERDINSSKNILKVLINKLKGLERPDYLKKKASSNQEIVLDARKSMIIPKPLKISHVKETKLLSLTDTPIKMGLGKLIGRKC